jgi:hypothetical protein
MHIRFQLLQIHLEDHRPACLPVDYPMTDVLDDAFADEVTRDAMRSEKNEQGDLLNDDEYAITFYGQAL